MDKPQSKGKQINMDKPKSTGKVAAEKFIASIPEDFFAPTSLEGKAATRTWSNAEGKFRIEVTKVRPTCSRTSFDSLCLQPRDHWN